MMVSAFAHPQRLLRPAQRLAATIKTCRSFSSTRALSEAAKKKRAVALSVHFKHPELGMRQHEILSRATAFLVAVDPPEADWTYTSTGKSDGDASDKSSDNTRSEISSMLEKSAQERQLRKLQQNYSRTPAGGPPRHPHELSWLEFCPVQHRPAVHVISSSHVISPWQWPNYYGQDWLKNVRLEHCSYSLDVFDMDNANSGNNKVESLAKFPLNPYPIHHPAEMDVAIMHLQSEDSALKHLKTLGVEPLYLRSINKAFERGQTVRFEGFEVAEDAADHMAGMEDAPGGKSNKSKNDSSEDDTRVFIPFTESGSLIYASSERFLAKTVRPLPEGLCGGPALDEDGNIAGIVEGIVPLNHDDERLAGAAAFLPSPVLKEFIDWAERLMLEKIVPEKLFDKIADLKSREGKALNEDAGEIEPPSSLPGQHEGGEDGGEAAAQQRTGHVLTDQGASLERAYDDMVATLHKNHTPEEVEAIKATIQREQQEVVDIMTTEGGDLDEVIARVRRRTREKQMEIWKEAEAAMSEDAKVVSEKDASGKVKGEGGVTSASDKR